jgi:formate dehydrogenase alpha subunit
MLTPDSVTRTTCPYCGVGCQMDLHVKDNLIFRVNAPFDTAPNFGMLCVKGRFGVDSVLHPSRVKTPLMRTNTGDPRHVPSQWREASWDEALDFIAARLAEIVTQHGGDAIATYASAKATNEDNYIFQRFVRGVLGTNNVDHCARLCHAGSVTALQLSLGTSAMSNSIAEMEHLDTFIVTGSNTTETHPVIANWLKKAVRKNGAKLIVIDPRQIEMTEFATLWLRQNVGTDVALWQAMAHVVVEERLYNEAFIDARTEGFAEYLSSLEECTPEWAEQITGVPAQDIRQAARMYATAKAAAVYWGMGISQSMHGTDNALAVANLALMCGHLGKPGTGLNPLRGQNNVQGASDTGGLPAFLTAYQKVADEPTRLRFEQDWGTALNPTPGLTVTEMIDGALAGTIKAMYVMGEDPMSSEPNLAHALEALEELDLLVCQDIFTNKSGELADVILPAASFAEKDGTFTNSDRRIQRVRTALPRVGQSRPDWQILCDLAQRIEQKLERKSIGWNYQNPSEIWEEMRRLTPDWGGITYERLEREGGVHWPCPSADHPGTPTLFAESFPRGRGKFWALEFSQASNELPDSDYPLILSTGRVLYHWSGGAMTRRSSLDAAWPEATLELHPADAEKMGLKTNDWVKVTSRRGTITLRALVTGRSPEGVVFVPFHFAEAAANQLTHHKVDPRAKIPDYKLCAVKVEKTSPPTDREISEESLLGGRGAIKDMTSQVH